jgi:hypothetical protein
MMAAFGAGSGGRGGQSHQGDDADRRRVKRMGRKRALVILEHKILVLVDKLLSDVTVYKERLTPEESA